MTPELEALVLVSLFSVVLAFVPLVALIAEQGLAYAAGNRDEGRPLPAWGDRAQRAQWNLIANLPAFAAIVLVAAVAGVSNESTVFGAQLFLWARVAHAVIYIVGIPYLRAVAFAASLVGMLEIVRAL